MNLNPISMIKLIKKLDKKSSLYSYKYLYILSDSYGMTSLRVRNFTES